MPAQQRVQEYLEIHKIGAIFEGLMAKLISDMPDEPLHYMVRNLQRRIDRQEGSSGPRMTLAGRRISPVRRSLPVASTSADAISSVKDYDKPWQVKSKKIRPKKTINEDDKPEWDHRTKSKSTFDALWEDKEADATKSRAVNRSSPPPAGKTVGFLGETDEFCSYGYRGPCAARSDDDDPLANEFPASSQRTGDQATPGVSSSIGPTLPMKSSHTNSDERRRRILAITAQKADHDSGIDDDGDFVQDDEALELLEDEDDLMNEGVKNMKLSGVRRSQMPSRAKNDTKVKVSICARCARVMAGEPSEPIDDYGQLPDYDNEREFPRSRPQSTQQDGSDEEFESVSQVTGPRRPVWDDNSEVQEDRTAVKGNHMFSSTNIPTKGRPMFSSEIPDWGHTPTTRHRRGHEGQHSMAVEVEGERVQQRDAVNQSWAAGMHRRRNDDDGWDFSTKKDDEGKVLPPDGGNESHRAWRVDEGSDGDEESSFYGGGGVRKETRSSKHKLSYQGAY